ncbi:MAG TPA: hypothetical protein ACFCUY_02770 [Xenococcaceae cyanobacterium]
MRRRNKRLNAVPKQNLDSFLDILTNTVGVLMFISLFVTLITVEADSIVRTPLATETKKTPRFFEIRDNKVTYINDAQVGAEIETIVGNLPACNRPDFSLNSDLTTSREYLVQMSRYRSCLQSRANRLINFQTQTKYYTVKMINASSFSLLYQPLETQPGETKEQFSQSNSDFKQILAELNPSEEYLAFIVRPNSFSGFRAAREIAWAEGFEVGWEPHKTELPIIFGSGGRAIGVQ